ncbi:MAG: amidohydrolase family protein, partial [Janthinobacterium lividum]
ELFGPQRLMFGSDWPVVTLRCGYADWWRQAQQLAANLAEADRAALFGGTAERFYGLAHRP